MLKHNLLATSGSPHQARPARLGPRPPAPGPPTPASTQPVAGRLAVVADQQVWAGEDWSVPGFAVQGGEMA